MPFFTPVSSAIGGALIGASAAILLLGVGRIAGISGIFGGLVVPRKGDVHWRLAFVGGLVLGGLAMTLLRPELFVVRDVAHRSLGVLALAGFVVGIGTRMGNGCTSGHGVCGISRSSPRSLAATLTFVGTGAATVYVTRHLLGVLS